MAKKSCVLFCNCSAGIFNDEKLKLTADVARNLDADVYELNDLCALTITKKEFLAEIEDQYEIKNIIACYPRAVNALFKQAGIDATNLHVLNMRELSSSEIEKELSEEYNQGTANYESIESGLDVPAWFPVIETDKCTSCGQCAKFCLFGVYKFENKKLEVVNPLNCKNLCPACGRTCPTSAIIFPRLKENTTLSGAIPGTFSVDAGSQEQSLFTTLQSRNRNRKSILKSGVMEQAEEERKKAINEFMKLNKPNKNN